VPHVWLISVQILHHPGTYMYWAAIDYQPLTEKPASSNEMFFAS